MTRFALICSLFSVLALGNLGCMEGLTAEEIAACSNDGQEFCPDATGALVCVDTLTDDHNCGTCGFLCTNGAQCVAGVCDCSGNETLSAGCPVDGKVDAVMCVDLKDDPRNCGACGNICLSGLCADFVCIPVSSTCTDGIKDGAESDVDCGDGCGAKCVNGKMCRLNSDCVSGYCNASGICADAPVGACAGKPSGTLCRAVAGPCDIEEKCDGVHSDCPLDVILGANTQCVVPGDGAGICSGSDAICRPTGLCSNVTCPSGYICDPITGGCVLPNEVSCHGAEATYNASDLQGASCLGWQKKTVVSGVVVTPNITLVPSGNVVTGGNNVCAITCSKGGVTLAPNSCSYVWISGGATDVARYSTTGCCKMPDHPVSDAPQGGCTFDGRCDDFCPLG